MMTNAAARTTLMRYSLIGCGICVCVLVFVIGSLYSQDLYRDPFVSVLPKKDPVVTSNTPVAFQAPKEIIISPPEITIQGILWGTDNPMAIIDGEVYAVGDIIKPSESRVYKIEEGSVFVMYKNKLFEIGITKGAR